MKNFALIGAAGYVAPRHMKAIKDLGHDLVCAFDLNDSVGILDKYSPNCLFFTNYGDFIRGCIDSDVDYMVICSPNYTHINYIQSAISWGFKVICEKPLVIHEKDLYLVKHKNVKTILQLRYHPELLGFHEYLEENKGDFFDVDLKYYTYRGDWYHMSWKGNKSLSGGINMNIGVHLFDVLIWLFGKFKGVKTIVNNKYESRGIIHFDSAEVNWHLAIDRHISDPVREMTCNGQKLSFSNGFTGLHKKCYEEILKGRGFGVGEAAKAIKLVNAIDYV